MVVPLTVELESKDRDRPSKSLKCMNTFRVVKQKLHVLLYIRKLHNYVGVCNSIDEELIARLS